MPLKKPDIFETAFEAYQTIKIIGEGGSGIVYLVKNSNGDNFAIKCLKPDKVTGNRLKRFKNELFFCLKNINPNIIRVLDYGFIPTDQVKVPFFIMHYYPNTLRNLMKEGIEHGAVLGIISQVLDGVEAAHLKRIWHRDLKPENLLYDPNGGTYIVSDFGVAHFSQEELHTKVDTKSTERLASFLYAAPEQRIRGQKVDARADIYAIGLMINEMFTNQPPLGTAYKNIESVAPDYAYLDEIVELMIRNNPAERLTSIDGVKKELISRQKEFVSRQKLSQIDHTVIPKYKVDDPLVLNPIELKTIDFKNGKLILSLNNIPTPKWICAFQTIGNFQYILGKQPSQFQFGRDTNKVAISAEERQVQTLVSYFKEYVSEANAKYKTEVVEENLQKEIAEKKALQKEREEEERRLRIIRNTKV